MINEIVLNELEKELHSYKKSLTDMLLLKYTSLYEIYLKCIKNVGLVDSYKESCEHAKQVLYKNLSLFKNSEYFTLKSYKEYVYNIELYTKRTARELYAIELGYDKTKSQYDKENRLILNSDEYRISIGFNRTNSEVISSIKRNVNSYVRKHFSKIEETLTKHIKENVKKITMLSYKDGCKGFEGAFSITYEDDTKEIVNLYAVPAYGPVQRYHYRYILTVTSKRK